MKCAKCMRDGGGTCERSIHGRLNTYYRHGCKCDECKGARAYHDRHQYNTNDKYRESAQARGRKSAARRKDHDSAIAEIRARIKAEREARGLAVASI